MTYHLVWEIGAASAFQRLRRINSTGAQTVRRAVNDLLADPRPADSTQLGESGFWRLRVQHYRVTYQVDDSTVTVIVVNVGRVPQRPTRGEA